MGRGSKGEARRRGVEERWEVRKFAGFVVFRGRRRHTLSIEAAQFFCVGCVWFVCVFCSFELETKVKVEEGLGEALREGLVRNGSCGRGGV